MADALPFQKPLNADPPTPAARPRRTRPPLAVDARRLAKLLTAGVRSIRTWDAAGKLPRPFKLGGRTLWYLPEVRAWLEAGAPCRAEWEARKRAASKK